MSTRRDLEVVFIDSALSLGFSLKRPNWYKWVGTIKGIADPKFLVFRDALLNLFEYLLTCKKTNCIDGDAISLDVLEVYVKMRISLGMLYEKSDEQILKITGCTREDVNLWRILLDGLFARMGEIR